MVIVAEYENDYYGIKSVVSEKDDVFTVILKDTDCDLCLNTSRTYFDKDDAISYAKFLVQ